MVRMKFLSGLVSCPDVLLLQDFGGGELMFNDVDVDRVLQPRGGQLIIFSSGLENLHQVLPMQWGSRYVLALSSMPLPSSSGCESLE